MPIIFQEMAQSRQPEQPKVIACLGKEEVLALWGQVVGTCGLAISANTSCPVVGVYSKHEVHFNSGWESHRALFTALMELIEGLRATAADRDGFELNVQIGNAIYKTIRYSAEWRFYVSYADAPFECAYTLIQLTPFELSQRKFILS